MTMHVVLQALYSDIYKEGLVDYAIIYPIQKLKNPL